MLRGGRLAPVLILVALSGCSTQQTATQEISPAPSTPEAGRGDRLLKGPASRPAASSQPAGETVLFETVRLPGDSSEVLNPKSEISRPAMTLQIAYRPHIVAKHPAILMLGALDRQLPEWSTNLVREGYMLVAFSAAYPPDADPARRPQWLFFDQRFAHSYVVGGYRAANDAKRVVEYMVSRVDVHPDKIGWLGSSSTGIPGLAVATRGPRLAAVVAFVSTGAYRKWLETWHTNGLWRGQGDALWPESERLLKYDPILHVDKLYPTAVLMISGGNDKVVDPATARAFMDAARPYYQNDEERLRLVVYDGFGHNLPRDIIRMYAEHWFHLYMHPTNPPPPVASAPADLKQSVIHTQINAADHKDVVGAK